MTFLKQLFLGVCGLSFGFLSSAGVFTVLASVGLIPRFAGRMHVARKIFVLEEGVVLGTLVGGAFSVYTERLRVGGFILENQIFGDWTGQIWTFIGIFFLITMGFFAGMFVGCLAFAIAEMLNSIPIFARRIGFRHGLGIAITAAAAGKLVGSFLYFSKEIFLTGM